MIGPKVAVNFAFCGCEGLPGSGNTAQCTVGVQYPLPPSLSLEAQEHLESLKKSSIVVVQILMLYLVLNNLWLHQHCRDAHIYSQHAPGFFFFIFSSYNFWYPFFSFLSFAYVSARFRGLVRSAAVKIFKPDRVY